MAEPMDTKETGNEELLEKKLEEEVGVNEGEEAGGTTEKAAVMPMNASCSDEVDSTSKELTSVNNAIGGDAGSNRDPHGGNEGIGDRRRGGAHDETATQDIETRLRIAESELRLRRVQEGALRRRLGDAALWAAEAARQLGAERRRGEVRCATAASFEAQHLAALKATDELRARLGTALAERDAALRAAALLKDEIADLKHQLQMHGQHLTCQLDLENAAVKYQGKIKEYLLLICRNLKQLEEEQNMLKQSVASVSDISEKMEKGVNHYSCKEKLWIEERKSLENKMVELGAEVERLKKEADKVNLEKTKYYDAIVDDLQSNLKTELEKKARLIKTMEEIKKTEINYEHKIEELIHQIHEKKEHVELLEKEKADLHNMLKHNEREMEIMERKHKYELDYAKQRPLAFSCETQTEIVLEEMCQPSKDQTNQSDCALCRTRAQCAYKQRRQLNRPNTPFNTCSSAQSGIISIPSSQNNDIKELDPYICEYNKPLFVPCITMPNFKAEPISLDSLSPVDDYSDVQWFTRRCDTANTLQFSSNSKNIRNSYNQNKILIDFSDEKSPEYDRSRAVIDKNISYMQSKMKRSIENSNLSAKLELIHDPKIVQRGTGSQEVIHCSNKICLTDNRKEPTEMQTDTPSISYPDVAFDNIEQVRSTSTGEEVNNDSSNLYESIPSKQNINQVNQVHKNENKAKRRILKVLH